MKNERLHEGLRISLPVATGLKSGAPVISGPFVGVLATDEGGGGNSPGYASVWRQGCFNLSTADAVATTGAALYITAANVLTTTATGNTLFGYTVNSAEGKGGTKAAGAGTVAVIIKAV